MRINTIPLPEDAANLTPMADAAATARIESALETMSDADAYAFTRRLHDHFDTSGEMDSDAALEFLQAHRPAFQRPARFAKAVQA